MQSLLTKEKIGRQQKKRLSNNKIYLIKSFFFEGKRTKRKTRDTKKKTEIIELPRLFCC